MAVVSHEAIFELVSRYGYALVFVFGVCEALPLVGVIVPGHATILLAGVAAAAGLLDVRWLIFWALLAGVLGDAIGFWISRRYGQEFLDRYGAKLRIRPEHVAKSNAVFEKHGPWALVLVRFSFIARGIGPLLAGLSGMPWRTFWIYNVVGAVLWSVGNALGGYFFGVAFFAAQAVVGKILAYTAVAVLGVYLLYRVLRKLAPGFTRRDFAVAMLAIVAGSLFGLLADHVVSAGLDNPLDRRADALAQFFAPVSTLARAVDLLTGFALMGTVALLMIAVLVARGRAWQAILVALSVGGVIALSLAVQPAFNAIPQGRGGADFPSAHAAIPLVLVTVATYLVAERVQRWGAPVAVAGVGLVVVALASTSRMAQGTEYPSSVLAGLLLGIAWFGVSFLLVEYAVKRPRRPVHAAPDTSP